MTMRRNLLLCGLVLLVGVGREAFGEGDAYENYVKTSKDFQAVKQEKVWALKAFPSWTYMPWTYQWTIGYTPESGKWAVEHGYNGAFVDHGGVEANGSKTGRLDWINEFKLRFYTDHIAGKGDLHQWDQFPKAEANKIHGNGVRIHPVNAAMATR